MRIQQFAFALALTGIWLAPLFAQPENFSKSLHASRVGKVYWYGADNGGFESMTNIPIEELGCVHCHAKTNADGEEYGEEYEPGCGDCHPSSDFANVQVTTCYGCHARQAVEAMKLGVSDVHREAGMVCWDCHSSEDIHGDGTEYANMFEQGAIDVDCEKCHPADALPEEHAGYNPHGGKLHCTACHAQTVVSCYNCHFESMTEAHVKRAKQPIGDFVLLVNRAKDGKIGTASFQTLTYQGHAFVAFGPYTPHTITREGRQCQDCHVNLGGDNTAIAQYNQTGKIQFAKLNDDGSLTWMHGVVPIPEDYQTTFKLDFITFDGDVSTPAGEDNMNWSSLGKESWDGHQMFYASPLTREQMEKLGFEVATAVEETGTATPSVFALLKSYPNPFNSSVTIPYRIAETGRIRLEIFSQSGQKVATLVDQVQKPGSYQVSWNGTAGDGTPVSSGTYLVKLWMENESRTGKLVLLK